MYTSNTEKVKTFLNSLSCMNLSTTGVLMSLKKNRRYNSSNQCNHPLPLYIELGFLSIVMHWGTQNSFRSVYGLENNYHSTSLLRCTRSKVVTQTCRYFLYEDILPKTKACLDFPDKTKRYIWICSCEAYKFDGLPLLFLRDCVCDRMFVTVEGVEIIRNIFSGFKVI